MLKSIKKYYNVTDTDPASIGPLKLAYIGDSVYELIIRSTLMDTGERSVKKMNKLDHDLVNATAQAVIAKRMEPLFTEEERTIFKRGRNAKNNSASKHANIRDYRIATGLESVFGYWYLSGQMDRAVALLRSVYKQRSEDTK